MKSDTLYLLRRNGNELGPFTQDKIRTLASAKKLSPADEIRRLDSPKWRRVSEVKGLGCRNGEAAIQVVQAVQESPIRQSLASTTQDGEQSTAWRMPSRTPLAAGAGILMAVLVWGCVAMFGTEQNVAQSVSVQERRSVKTSSRGGVVPTHSRTGVDALQAAQIPGIESDHREANKSAHTRQANAETPAVSPSEPSSRLASDVDASSASPDQEALTKNDDEAFSKDSKTTTTGEPAASAPKVQLPFLLPAKWEVESLAVTETGNYKAIASHRTAGSNRSVLVLFFGKEIIRSIPSGKRGQIGLFRGGAAAMEAMEVSLACLKQTETSTISGRGGIDIGSDGMLAVSEATDGQFVTQGIVGPNTQTMTVAALAAHRSEWAALKPELKRIVSLAAQSGPGDGKTWASDYARPYSAIPIPSAKSTNDTSTPSPQADTSSPATKPKVAPWQISSVSVSNVAPGPNGTIVFSSNEYLQIQLRFRRKPSNKSLQEFKIENSFGKNRGEMHGSSSGMLSTIYIQGNWKGDDFSTLFLVGSGHRQRLDQLQPAEVSGPGPAAVSDSNAAERALRLAKLLMKSNPMRARQRLEEIVEKFPDTPSAKSAALLLKTLK